jgi:hypothetical protein
MTPGIWFSTSPFEGKTHWCQTYFPLCDIIVRKKGDLLRGSVDCRPMEEDHRAIVISINLEGLQNDET